MRPAAPETSAQQFSPDGLSFLDAQGRPPKLDADRRLLEPFVLTLATGASERWGAGLIFTPQTPREIKLRNTALNRARAEADRLHRKLTPSEQAAAYWGANIAAPGPTP